WAGSTGAVSSRRCGGLIQGSPAAEGAAGRALPNVGDGRDQSCASLGGGGAASHGSADFGRSAVVPPNAARIVSSRGDSSADEPVCGVSPFARSWSAATPGASFS